MSDPYVIEMSETGGVEVLVKTARAPRQPGPGQVLVRQTASGLNFIDTYHRTGLYPVKLPFVPGSEGAGVVEAVGEGVDHIALGDRVAYLGSGTYATHYTGPAATMVKLPDGISEQDAAAVLLKGLTAWMLLFEVRRASPGETALVWAPVGGVGSLLVPWATALGVDVIAVTSSDAKASRARELGARAVVLSSQDVAAEVRGHTGGAGVDVSYDSVGKTSAQASLDSLKPRGWWVSYGNASGAADPIAPGALGARGSLILTRPSLFHFISDADSLRRGAAALFGAMRTGTIAANVGQTFPLSEIADAHTALESGKTVGATVLLP
ncbi:MAG: quinone oxidoreductase [Hyphomonadaceae bacterium]|nr:quinone oxidoreductase [Hyphomonadaceae bacterium]